ncbi:MAG: hypothetical protein ABSF83_02735 [Nitrososphaerales archaeon]
MSTSHGTVRRQPSSSKKAALVLLLFAASSVSALTIWAPSDAHGDTPVYVVPITITNSQSAATAVNFQQQVTVNWQQFSAHLRSDIGNVRFYSDSAATRHLYAWCESSCFTGALSASQSSVVWVNLGNSTVPASGGSLTIYMGFLSTSTTFDGVWWGEAPQYSATYGQYDNGPKVFATCALTVCYANFNGTTEDASLFTNAVGAGGSVTQSNGLVITSTEAAYTSVATTNAIMTSGQVVDIYALLTWGSAVDSFIGIYHGPASSNGEIVYENVAGTHGILTQSSSGPSTATTIYQDTWGQQVYSFGWSYSGTATAYYQTDYGFSGTSTSVTADVPASGSGKALIGECEYSSGDCVIAANWFRIRMLPPSGVMPAAVVYGQSLGSIGASPSSITWSAGAHDVGTADGYSCVTYSGRIYCVGSGRETAWATASGGDVGPWTSASSSFPNVGIVPHCVQNSGYVYCQNDGAATVYYAQLLTTGFGTWTAATSLPAKFIDGSCVTATASGSSYVYCMGNEDTPQTQDLLYYAKFSSSPPGLSAWSTAAVPFPLDTANSNCGVIGTTVFCGGGYSSGTTAGNAYYATLTSAGTTGWTRMDDIPTNDWYGSCVTVGPTLYCIGGYPQKYNGGATTPSGVVYSNSGTPFWQTATSYYPTVDMMTPNGCATDGTYIYCVGGYTTGYLTGPTASVYVGTLSAGPSDITWSSQPQIPGGTLQDFSCGYYSGYIYCVGSAGTTYYASASGGVVGTWNPTTPYPESFGTFPPSCVTNAGYIYCVGGTYTTLAATAHAYSAPVSSSGIGAWTPQTAYPQAISLVPCVTYSSAMFCFGGNGGSGGPAFTAATEEASLSSGTIGAWHAGTDYPLAVYNQGCAQDAGTVVCVGGIREEIDVASVYYATLSTTFPYVSSWDKGTPLPIAVHDMNCVYTNAVFCVGGDTSAASGGVEDVMTSLDYHISIAPTGSWTADTETPQALGQWPTGSTVSDGTYAYTIGGATFEGGAYASGYPDTYTADVWSSRPVAFVTLPLVCTLSQYGTDPTLALSASSGPISPATAACSHSGTTTDIRVYPSVTVTAAVPAISGGTGYWFASQTNATSTASCSATSLCPTWTVTVWQLETVTARVTANDGIGGVFDAGLTWTLAITQAGGTGSATISSTAAATDSKFLHVDFDSNVVYPANPTGAAAGVRWQGAAPLSLNVTAGAGTQDANYFRQLQTTYTGTSQTSSASQSQSALSWASLVPAIGALGATALLALKGMGRRSIVSGKR